MTTKYRVTFSVQMDVEIDEQSGDPFPVVRKQLQDGFSNCCNIKLLKLDKIRQQKSKVVLGEFYPDDVLPYASDNNEKREYVINGKSYLVNMDSQRYFVFRVSRRCAACGLEGMKMLLEMNPRDKNPHFNLYAIEHGELVLMTKDHIQPISAKGKNVLSNYATMCSTCNNLKGNVPLRLDDLRKLREIFNEKRGVMGRKRLAAFMEHQRQELFAAATQITQPPKPEPAAHWLGCDVMVVEPEIGMPICLPMKTALASSHKQIASIRQGTPLIPIAESDDCVYITLGDRQVAVYKHMVEEQQS